MRKGITVMTRGRDLYRAEKRTQSRREEKKASDGLVLLAAFLITLVIMVIGFTVFYTGGRSLDAISMAIAFLIIYCGVIVTIS